MVTPEEPVTQNDDIIMMTVRKYKRIIIIVVLFLVILCISTELIRYCYAHSVQSKWQRRLEATLSSSPTPEDARMCLESNGFNIVWWNGNDAKGWIGVKTSGDQSSQIILGSRENEISWPLRSASDRLIIAEIEFNPEFNYQGIHVSLGPISSGQ